MAHDPGNIIACRGSIICHIFCLLLKQDKVRKSLHVLQPTATNKENLVGGRRMLRSALTGKETHKG